jgi:FMN-dependent NADH-azoreductase
VNHDFNAAFNTEDAGGPILRSLIVISCTGADIGYQFVGANTAKGERYLQTLLEVAGIPRKQEIPVNFKTEEPNNTCQYVKK